MNKKVWVLILSVCLAVSMLGCATEKAPPLEIEEPVNEPVPVETPAIEDVPDEYEEPKEFVGFSVDYQNTEYSSFAEAYLDILNENRLLLTNEQPSDEQKRMGLNIGDGQIAVIDIFGDEIPELLCLYYNGMESALYLTILSYSKTDGTESIFDNVVYRAIGGEHNYCVYITRDGELMLFLWSSGVNSKGGFWPIKQKQYMEYDPHPSDGFSYSRDLAAICYADMPVDFYMQYGNEISKDQFDIVTKEIIGNIDGVLFQGAVLGDLGLRLYKDVDLWRDITPSEADSMAYDEAVEWLKDR